MEFHSKYCLVQAKDTKTDLLQGVLRDGLYQLTNQSPSAECAVYVYTSLRYGQENKCVDFPVINSTVYISKSSSFDVWHKQLGHPGRQVV